MNTQVDQPGSLVVAGGSPAAFPGWNPWANDRKLLDLYARRCRREVEEMTCAAQAAQILAQYAAAGETLLDVGCGGGYYYWSFAQRRVPVAYYGLDYTPQMVAMAQRELCPRASLAPECFRLGALEYLNGPFDNIVCFNVLTNSPHYALGLERLLRCTRKRLLLRESLGDGLVVRYTPDPYLDADKRHIRVYHNTYPYNEVTAFIENLGFKVSRFVDERTNDGVEMVCDIPHHWRIILAEREDS
jgi:SAM-dependent methyltransferase